MITKLKLENFRVFGKPVTVRFRPITVLIGRNNAGKSSVINFLLMLQQSMDPMSPDFLNPRGSRVKMGNFRDLRHANSGEEMLGFELEGHTSKVVRDVEDMLKTTAQALEEMRVFQETTKPPMGSRRPFGAAHPINPAVTFSPPKGDGQPGASFHFAAEVPYHRTANGNQKIQTESDGGLRIKLEKPFRRNAAMPMAFTDLQREGYAMPPAAMLNHLAANVTGKAKRGGGISAEKDRWNFTESMLIDMYLTGIRAEVASMGHLLPNRRAFRSVLELSNAPRNSVGQDGRHALPHLKTLLEKPGLRAAVVSRYLNSVCDIEKIYFRKTDYLADAYIKVTAVSSRTKAEHRLPYFGFGVSQALPVIAQGAITPRGAQFMVEQPESQLHPTAQLEMGEFFADIWNKFGVGSIIETHSDNILLRLRRLIANGTLNNDDVSVAFFDIKKGKAKVENLDIEPDGSMRKGLPMEFFHANIGESLRMRAKQ